MSGTQRLLATLGLVLRPIVWAFALIAAMAIAFPPEGRTIGYGAPDRLSVALDSGFERLDPAVGWLYPVVLDVAIPRPQPAADDVQRYDWKAPWLGVRFFRTHSAGAERLVLGLLPLVVLTSVPFWCTRPLRRRDEAPESAALGTRVLRSWIWVAAIVGAALTFSASEWGSRFSPAVCASGFPVDAARGDRGLRIIWVREDAGEDGGRSPQADYDLWLTARYGVRHWGARTYRYLVLRPPALAATAVCVSGGVYLRWRRERGRPEWEAA